MSSHDFYRLFDSRPLGKGLPMFTRLLGHRKAETTARYAHPVRASLKSLRSG